MKTVTLTNRELAVLSLTLGMALRGLQRGTQLPFTVEEISTIGEKLRIADAIEEMEETRRVLEAMRRGEQA